MKIIPVFDSFQTNVQIGELHIETAKLPARPDFCFALGYTANTTDTGDPAAPHEWELLAIAPVSDENYGAFLTRTDRG
jgi:hypothetical protein